MATRASGSRLFSSGEPVKPMRIAMVGNGATVHALVRGAAIASLGHTVRLVTLGPVLPVPGIEVRSRPLPRTALEGFAAFRTFVRDLHDFEPDLLHVHYAGGRLGSLALASGIKPLVVTVMGGDVQPEQLMGRAGALDHRTTRRLLQEADLLLAKSQALADEIRRYGDHAAKTEVVHWGIDVARFEAKPDAGTAMRLELGLGEGPLLLSPRILRPLYNIHLIVEAMPEILRQRPDVTLLISRHREDVDYAAKLRQRVSELGIEGSVRFIEPVAYDDMPALLAATSVVVSVPFSDGLPQTLFECLAAGTPIVLGRLDAYGEMVEHEREVLLAKLDAPSIAEAVSRILNEAGLAPRLREAGRKRILETASLPEEARRVEDLYRGVLERGRRGSPLGPRILDAMSLAFRGGPS